MTLLVTYASTHGSTREMAQHLASQIHMAGFKSDLKSADEVTSLEGYSALILGSPVHCGLWASAMHLCLSRLRPGLTQVPVYAWITCMRVLEPNGHAHAREYYVPLDFRTLPTLRSIEIFAGKITPPELTWEEKHDLYHHYDGFYNITYAQGDYRNWDLFDAWIQWVISDLRTFKLS